jgi:membrane fusion protein (multidrug efflux system)
LLIEAAFPNPDFLIRPGQFVRVLFPRVVVTNAVLVPQRAVRELQGTFSVFVLGPDQKAQTRPVETGARVGSLWIIDSGLKPGERVIVEGLQKVQPGAVVKATFTNITDRAQQSLAQHSPSLSPSP